MSTDDRLPLEEPDEGFVPPAFADAVRVWHALEQLDDPAEAARAVAALDLTDLRRLVFAELVFRHSTRVAAEGGAVVMRGDLSTEARASVRRGLGRLGRLVNAVTEADLPGGDGPR